MASAFGPASLSYSLRKRSINWLSIHESDLASPGGSTAFQRHCAQRPELVIEPCFSKDAAAGNWKTSVLMSAGFAPGRCQKLAVSMLHRLADTIQSKLS